VAVSALVEGFNGHAPINVELWAKLTFESDHSTGADHLATKLPYAADATAAV